MSTASSVGRLLLVPLIFSASPAAAASFVVPRDKATLQEAVNAAEAGDTILVGPGSYCGATVDKAVRLVGYGQPNIIGCDTGPALSNGVRVGFLLPGSQGTSSASGAVIAGFNFDGRGVSNSNLTPLGFGILGRFASQVSIVSNRFMGTVQPITNTAGDRWFIAHNRIEDLRVFDCSAGGFCTGGDGIVVQVARGSLAVPGGASEPANRPEGNVILGNRVSGSIPDGFDDFGWVGILVFAADRTTISGNALSIPDNPDADAPGQGILITNVCCGDPAVQLPGARNTLALFNDASRSEFGIVVEGSGGQNTEGLLLEHNRGRIVIEGEEQDRPHTHHRWWRPKQRWF